MMCFVARSVVVVAKTEFASMKTTLSGVYKSMAGCRCGYVIRTCNLPILVYPLKHMGIFNSIKY